MSEKIHSYQYLQDYRFEWWNQDFLELLAKRLNLSCINSMADIGIGLGHWSRLLLPFLSTPLHFVGVDIESFWLEKAQETFSVIQKEVNFSELHFIKDDAHNLSLTSDTFDLVTCQTLLMHCYDPKKVLAEMKRIAKPGGIILAVEPVNLLNRLEFSSVLNVLSVEDQTSLFRFWSYFHQGLRTKQKGDHNIGCYLPGLFKELGLEGITAYQNDRVCYSVSHNSTSVDEILMEYMKPETSELIIAGGGSDMIIAQGLNSAKILAEHIVAQIDSDNYYSTGFLSTFVFIGFKPGAVSKVL
jgi:ubiquinone/menaquinone biosynthesis C-methylase UbiE